MTHRIQLAIAIGAGALAGFVIATYSAGQYLAIQTTLRDTERDEMAANYTERVNVVIEKAAHTLEEMRTERDAALAELDGPPGPKVVKDAR